MELMDIEMQGLVAKAKAQGYLTYEDVNRYLPDEDVSSEKLDNLFGCSRTFECRTGRRPTGQLSRYQFQRKQRFVALWLDRIRFS